MSAAGAFVARGGHWSPDCKGDVMQCPENFGPFVPFAVMAILALGLWMALAP